MTPSQLDHLRRIDAHLERLLQIAKKRTPGRWEVKPFGNYDEYEVHPPVRCGEPAESNGLTLGDASFIAACTGNAEAGWRVTRDLINWIIITKDTLANTRLLQATLTQWPIESLNS